MPKGKRINVEKVRREIVADRLGVKIANHMGINRFSLYRKFSTGKLTLDDLNKICAYLGRDVAEFLDEFELEVVKKGTENTE